MAHQSKHNATLHISAGPVSLEEMHDLTDVFMSAIHVAFAGRKIDGRALAGSLVCAGLGVLKDLGVDDPRSAAHAFVDAVDIADIQPFERANHS
jgi:hypothetical protein